MKIIKKIVFNRIKKKSDSEYNYLELVPVRNYEHKINDDGKIDVLVPRFTDKFFGRFLQPKLKNPYIRANLDETGTKVWSLIDGKKDVRIIIDETKEHFGNDLESPDERVILFLKNLYRNGFIKFYQINKE